MTSTGNKQSKRCAGVGTSIVDGNKTKLIKRSEVGAVRTMFKKACN